MIRSTNVSTPKLNLTRKYSQSDHWKPRGLWYSINESWIKWCKDNMDHWIKPYNIEIEIDESKMCIIKTPEDLDKFVETYVHPSNRTPNEYWSRQVNWNDVVKDYSGIEIQNYSSIKYYRTYKMTQMWFDGWDVSSGCIWDLSIIKKCQTVNQTKNEKK